VIAPAGSRGRRRSGPNGGRSNGLIRTGCLDRGGCTAADVMAQAGGTPAWRGVDDDTPGATTSSAAWVPAPWTARNRRAISLRQKRLALADAGEDGHVGVRSGGLPNRLIRIGVRVPLTRPHGTRPASSVALRSTATAQARPRCAGVLVAQLVGQLRQTPNGRPGVAGNGSRGCGLPTRPKASRACRTRPQSAMVDVARIRL